jgi:methionyl-tRNA formyltransferase
MCARGKQRGRDIKTAFFGTSAFAVPSLRVLAESTDCCLVVTQPDRPAGRGRHVRSTPVKLAAQSLGISTIEPERLHRVAAAELFAQPFDLFVVASYGKIVPQWMLDIPRSGALNVHPSLLPLYRGATPLQAQIRDGVTLGGVTIMMMDAGMDTGDVVLRESCPIDERETYGELHDRFADLGASLLPCALEQVRRGRLVRTPQASLMSHERVAATLTRPLTKSDLSLEFSELTAREIVRRVRAYAPEPSARALLGGASVKLLAASVPCAAVPLPIGSVLIGCKDGQVVIERIVPPNRKAMAAAAYLR